MRWLMSVVVLVALTTSARADVLKVGDRAVELDKAVDAGGKAFKLKSLTNKWVLVTAGAAWCKPCKKELPTWDKVAKDYKDKITFVALALDNEIDDGKKFHKQLGLKHMKLIYMPEEKSAVAGSYGASTMPSSFIVDPKGIVRHIHSGFDERDASGQAKKLRAAIDKLLAK